MKRTVRTGCLVSHCLVIAHVIVVTDSRLAITFLVKDLLEVDFLLILSPVAELTVGHNCFWYDCLTRGIYLELIANRHRLSFG